ncbi:MAG: glycosyltransferase family A protein [Hyphomonas sp.]
MNTSKTPKLSVVITNYNYAAFVGTAIDSVLSQDAGIELVVVDDCSKDNSREVIRSYGDRVIPVLQDVNQGHGGGFNAGYARTTGDLVMFLDADDFLLPGAAATILSNYDPAIGMYLYRMNYADEHGTLGGLFPPPQVPLADGDVSAQLREQGHYSSTITSGLVYTRAVLEKVMPMDSETFRQGGDGYLSATVPLHTQVKGFDTPISAYRLHGSQHSQFAKAYAKRARWRIGHQQACFACIREQSARLGLPVAADLGERDPGHLQERLVSFLFEPELHPVPADTRRGLLAKLRNANRERFGAKALPRNIWWILIGVLPGPAAQTLLSWKIDVAARPVWLNTLGRTLRKRLGVVTG